MSKLLDGCKIAKDIRDSVEQTIAQAGITPGLAIILVGSDAASHIYVALKERRCKEIGIHFEKYLFFHTESQEKIIAKIHELNERQDIHAILVQLPMPAQFDAATVIQNIDPKKDVDGFHIANFENLMKGDPRHPKPVLVKAITKLLKETGELLQGKSVKVVANSDIFMKPVGSELVRIGMSVEWMNPEQPDLFAKIEQADVLIVAIGLPWTITPNMLKPGVTVIDVGMTRDEQTGELLGDAHPNVAEVASWLTPVPGGVGPVTVAMLLENTMLLAQHQTTRPH